MRSIRIKCIAHANKTSQRIDFSPVTGLIKNSKYKEALLLLDKIYETHQSGGIVKNKYFYNIKAEAEVCLGLYSEAIQTCDTAFSHRTFNVVTFNMKAKALHYLNKHAVVIKTCKKALSWGFRNVITYNTMAKAFSNLGHYTDTIRTCNEAIDQNIHNSGTINIKAKAFDSLGYWEKADHLFQESLRITCTEDQPTTYIEILEHYLAKRDKKKIITTLRELEKTGYTLHKFMINDYTKSHHFIDRVTQRNVNQQQLNQALRAPLTCIAFKNVLIVYLVIDHWLYKVIARHPAKEPHAHISNNQRKQLITLYPELKMKASALEWFQHLFRYTKTNSKLFPS